jgi:dihydroneopterin aldolase
MSEAVKLDGLVPRELGVRSAKIKLDQLEVAADIGFHDFEVGAPQRLRVTVEVWLDAAEAPADDSPQAAWDYDVLKLDIEALAAARRYNLQETLAHEIYAMIAARHGVRALRVATCKPDIYPRARGVGVEIASFDGGSP